MNATRWLDIRQASGKARSMASLALAAGALLMSVPSGSVFADTASVNVVIISSKQFFHGGVLVTDVGGGPFDYFHFVTMPVAQLDATSLASYDTAVLNVDSFEMSCTTATLTAAQKAALVAFVFAGGKLIIYDSSCPYVDYSWLPFPFNTIPVTPPAPPGQGLCEDSADTSLAIVEENTLVSGNPASPYYVDGSILATKTNAVSDANVFATSDLHWCLDMAASRRIFQPGEPGVSGPGHAYVRYGSGLIIYNGLNQAYQSPTSSLAVGLVSMWLQELEAAFNPVPLADMPCGVTPNGLYLTPYSAVNDAGTPHTVTATLTDVTGHARPGVGVTFSVVSGPNVGSGGTCSPANCQTDATGHVTFTYGGQGGVGTDGIRACSVNAAGQNICSGTVFKEWVTTTPAAMTNVAFVKSRFVQGGGQIPPQGGNLPTSGGAFNAFTFTDQVKPEAITATNLSLYGTIVLNLTSLNCDDTSLSDCQKADLVDWVSKGGKLILYDSECSAVDYSWLPFPFTTSNPGFQRQPGTLKIVEENSLSSTNPSSPYYVNAPGLTGFAEVGDANVIVTSDPHWCIDMTAVNTLGVAGPVQMYARYGSGLFIYDGMDLDVLGTDCGGFLLQCDPPDGLEKIWLLQIQVPSNPTPLADLPCSFAVVGISLTPLSATNEAGTSHTVTAALTDAEGHARPDVAVAFTVVSGPNTGAGGACSPANCQSDAEGHVSFTYTSNGQAGIDGIHACFTGDSGQTICSQTVGKEWVITNHPPACNAGGPYAAECSGATISLALHGEGSSDPDGDPLGFSWTSTCSGSSFDDPTSATPTLTLAGGCSVSCLTTLTVSDDHGHATTCDAGVSIVDTTPPTITCPADVVVTCGGSTDPSATGSAKGADACHPNPAITYSDVVTTPACAADPLERVIARTWTATDACNRTNTCLQTIKVAKVQARIDIKPGSCPNGFNPQGTGTVAVSIAAAPGFDVSKIVQNSVGLSRADCTGSMAKPKRLEISDSATPFYGTPCSCSAAQGDGLPDLSMSFARGAISDSLKLSGIPSGTIVPAAVTGRLQNGCGFVGIDCLAYVPGTP